MFQDGPLKAIKPVSCNGHSSVCRQGIHCASITTRPEESSHLPHSLLPRHKPTRAPCMSHQPGQTPGGQDTHYGTDCQRFPLGNFTYSLTLFPKFFSSFPHGTCSLSVSPRYLALDGVYHPPLRCIPKQRDSSSAPHSTPPAGPSTGFSPSLMLLSSRLGVQPRRSRHVSSIQCARSGAFNSGLVPLRSPLLGESMFVSLPPLIDMLKFSG